MTTIRTIRCHMRIFRAEMWEILSKYLFLDLTIGIFCLIYVLALFPHIFTSADSVGALMYSNRFDEPALTQCLESMTRFPWGDPANYWRHPELKPDYWSYINYNFFIYCGALQHTLAFLLFAPLKWLGVSTFPTGPILLRSVSMVAGLGILIVTYNFSKNNSGRLAAIVTACLTITMTQFDKFAIGSHPDLLMAFMAILSLIFAVTYIQSPSTTCLVLLGLAMGGAHSAKFGGPILVPMAMVTLLWSSSASCGNSLWSIAKMILRKGSILVAASFAGFIISTPHALFRLDYWNSILSAKNAYSLSNVGIIDWAVAAWNSQGVWFGAGFLIASIFIIFDMLRGRYCPFRILTLILALSTLSWFSFASPIQIVIYYLFITFISCNILIGDIVQRLQDVVVGAASRPIRLFYAPLILFALVVITVDRGSVTINNLQNYSSLRSPLAWNSAILRRYAQSEQTIMSDLSSIIIFDPNEFPKQVPIGTLKYVDLWRHRPDYFTLSLSLSGAPLYRHLRETQNLSMFDAFGFNVRLYQDLLDLTSNPYSPGPTRVPGIEIVALIGPPPEGVTARPGWLAQIPFIGAYLKPIWPQRDKLTDLARAAPALPTPELINTKDPQAYILYRLHPPGGPNGSPGPISGGASAPSSAANAFDNQPSIWVSRQVGAEVANAAYIGFDFGAGRRESVEGVKLTWPASYTMPSIVHVQFRDDAGDWTTVDQFDPAKSNPARSTTDPSIKSIEFRLTTPSRHRQWRLLAGAGLAEGQRFAIQDLSWILKVDRP